MSTKPRKTLERVVIRFAGDSGDGMQITGSQFTNTAAIIGNDLATLPDYPAEIRAPAGTLPGVSGFQVHLASDEIFTPGDRPDVLIAMNPAALKVNLANLPANGFLIVDTDAFDERNLQKAGYMSSPLEDGTLSAFRVFSVPLTSQTEANRLARQPDRRVADVPVEPQPGHMQHIRRRDGLLIAIIEGKDVFERAVGSQSRAGLARVQRP